MISSHRQNFKNQNVHLVDRKVKPQCGVEGVPASVPFGLTNSIGFVMMVQLTRCSVCFVDAGQTSMLILVHRFRLVVQIFDWKFCTTTIVAKRIECVLTMTRNTCGNCVHAVIRCRLVSSLMAIKKNLSINNWYGPLFKKEDMDEKELSTHLILILYVCNAVAYFRTE